jgi:hypothetical protein
MSHSLQFPVYFGLTLSSRGLSPGAIRGKFDGSKDRSKRAGTQPAMGIEQFAVLQLEVYCGPHISTAALLQVGLEEQALHLAAPVLLLGFNLMDEAPFAVRLREPATQWFR